MKLSLKQITLLASILFLTSCVVVLPKKKYDALLKEKAQLSSDLSASEKSNKDLVSKLKLANDTIAMLRADTAKLHAMILGKEDQIQNLNDNFKQMKSNSSDEIKKLLSQLEATRLDLAAREQRLKEVEDLMSRRDEAIKALKDKLTNALLGFKKSGLEVSIKDGKVYVSLTDKLLFNSGSIEIDAKGKEALVELSKVLKQQPEINILVEGHTDNVKVSNLGEIKDNWDLSVLRATAVTRFLVDGQKLEPIRLIASGRSEFFPVDKNNTTEAKSRNRRIEIILSPKLDEVYNLINGLN